MSISVDDLRGSDEETLGVYLMILHCRFDEGFGFNIFSFPNPSIQEFLSVYFGASSRTQLEKVKSTLDDFNNRVNEASDVEAKGPFEPKIRLKNEILDDLEERYFERFKEVFERFVRSDTIPEDYRIFVKKFLQLAHRRVIGDEFTRTGSAKVPYNQILVVAEELRGRESEFIDILRDSQLAYRGALFGPRRTIIIPSVAIALYERD